MERQLSSLCPNPQKALISFDLEKYDFFRQQTILTIKLSYLLLWPDSAIYLLRKLFEYTCLRLIVFLALIQTLPPYKKKSFKLKIKE